MDPEEYVRYYLNRYCGTTAFAEKYFAITAETCDLWTDYFGNAEQRRALGVISAETLERNLRRWGIEAQDPEDVEDDGMLQGPSNNHRLTIIQMGFVLKLDAKKTNSLLKVTGLSELSGRILNEAIAIFCLNNNRTYQHYVALCKPYDEMYVRRNTITTLKQLREYVDKRTKINEANGEEHTLPRPTKFMTDEIQALIGTDKNLRRFIETNDKLFSEFRETARYYLCRRLLRKLQQEISEIEHRERTIHFYPNRNDLQELKRQLKDFNHDCLIKYSSSKNEYIMPFELFERLREKLLEEISEIKREGAIQDVRNQDELRILERQLESFINDGCSIKFSLSKNDYGLAFERILRCFNAFFQEYTEIRPIPPKENGENDEDEEDNRTRRPTLLKDFINGNREISRQFFILFLIFLDVRNIESLNYYLLNSGFDPIDDENWQTGFDDFIYQLLQHDGDGFNQWLGPVCEMFIADHRFSPIYIYRRGTL